LRVAFGSAAFKKAVPGAVGGANLGDYWNRRLTNGILRLAVVGGGNAFAAFGNRAAPAADGALLLGSRRLAWLSRTSHRSIKL
jgi:hypothetical protein